ncbi:FAD/NAD(P)-binding protein [Streptomyces sp. NPDC003077]|uniref:FAD/NAD(P)-binding protein n=1 Tax=Streptomyces sp. NPDC003077 TaxID=3154443 RepID=UPI0033ABCF4B
MPAVPVPYRVVRRHQETADTATLEIHPVARRLPVFRPGQFAMLYAFGVGDIPVSVAGIGADGGLTHTIRAVGAVSGALYGLRPGDVLGARGPFGTGWEPEAAHGREVLVVAGGIGLAPLRPLILHVLARPDRYAGLRVVIGARTPDDLLYGPEVRQWSRAAEVAVTVDRAAPGWAGHVGVVTRLLGRVTWAPGRTTAFVCGPEPMIHATARDLLAAGVPPDRVRVSLERNMRCATGHCGHCQLGPLLLCRDGPVTGWDRAAPPLTVKEL